jgi:hypothetical protein
LNPKAGAISANKINSEEVIITVITAIKPSMIELKYLLAANFFEKSITFPPSVLDLAFNILPNVLC